MLREPALSYSECRQMLGAIPEAKKFDFVYYIYSEVLIGTVGGESFAIRAVSGGGRGGKHPESILGSYFPSRRTKKTRGSYQLRGGSLPPGLWRIEKPSTYVGTLGKPVAKLTPIGMQRTDYPMRDYDAEPFLIHGPGPLGSDGCIVIDKTHRKPLLDAIENTGGAILLVSADLQDGPLGGSRRAVV